MTILCSVMGHVAGTVHHRDQGLDFAPCTRCDCDLIRLDGAREWTPVPEGFRVVWREFGRAGDAASVAERMERIAQAPRRREPRSGRAKPQRQTRSRPFTGAASMIGTLAKLGSLISDEPAEDTSGIEASGQYVIRLPDASGRWQER